MFKSLSAFSLTRVLSSVPSGRFLADLLPLRFINSPRPQVCYTHTQSVTLVPPTFFFCQGRWEDCGVGGTRVLTATPRHHDT